MNVFRRRLTAGIALIVALFPLGCSTPKAKSAEPEHPLLGAPAPAFELPTADGASRVSLAEHAGKVVVVDFWATWCKPCRASFPAYQAIVDDFGPDVVVIGVSVDEEPEGIPAFAQATGVRFPLVWDEGQGVSQRYSPPTMPTSFVVDRSGIVRFVHTGFVPGDEQTLRAEIERLR
ncbi:MAG: TlpA disulfide reductase family protein [Pseudomonadota bacterium]